MEKLHGKPTRKYTPLNGEKFGTDAEHDALIQYVCDVHNAPNLGRFIAAQARAETAHYNRFVARGNYGNIKSAYIKRHNIVAYVNYHDDAPNDYFCEFSTWGHGVEAVIDLMKRLYPACYKAQTIEEFTDGLSRGVGGRKWATDKGYSELIKAVYKNLPPISIQDSSLIDEYKYTGQKQRNYTAAKLIALAAAGYVIYRATR